jgi:DNA repair protein RecO (recombination protein O)
MLVKSEALVVKRTPYTDHSAVVKLFTRDFGLIPFLIQGLHGKHNKNSLFQPGTLIEVVFHKQSRGMMRAKEVSLLSGWGYSHNPLHDQVRWFFLELLSHILHEEQPEEQLFDISKHTFQQLNVGCDHLPILPIQYLFEFCEVTGHGIQITEETKRIGFDILSGMPATSKSVPSNIIDGELCTALEEISINKDFTLPSKQRRGLVNKLVQYLEIHAIPGKTLKSLDILQMIMQEPQS